MNITIVEKTGTPKENPGVQAIVVDLNGQGITITEVDGVLILEADEAIITTLEHSKLSVELE